MNIYNLRALWDQIPNLVHIWVASYPIYGREKLQNPAILGEILGENHALKIDPQEENKKRTAW
jgi:hypothetical protein